MVDDMLFETVLLSSRWAVTGVLGVHLLVFSVILILNGFAMMTVFLCVITLCHGAWLWYQWHYDYGAFAITCLSCTADFEWQVCLRGGEPLAVELVSYQPTPLGLVLAWRVIAEKNGEDWSVQRILGPMRWRCKIGRWMPIGSKRRSRVLRHTVFKDQITIEAYRWLKVVLARAVHRAEP